MIILQTDFSLLVELPLRIRLKQENIIELVILLHFVVYLRLVS